MIPWQFDQKVAQVFVEHARKHIPGYDRVIDKSIDACRHHLADNARILDVGCATGETLRRLHQAGFTNVSGVDASQDMLDQYQGDANLYCSSSLPPGPWDAILCNWTLHFVPDKVSYLRSIWNNLSTGGFLILSEKTSLDPVTIQHYHNFKLRNGVSEQEILEKQRKVQDIMYINEPTWYLDTLSSMGFKNLHIVDADWCFTTFFCTK